LTHNKKLFFAWISAGIFVVAVLINLRLLDFVPNAVISVSSPIIRPINNATKSLKESFFKFYSFSAQVREVGNLRREVARLQAELVRKQVESEENSRLRRLLNISDTIEYPNVAAEIITWDSADTTLGATINRGRESGILEGQAVLDEYGNLAGIVETALSGNSYILFITDSRAKLDAIVLGKEAIALASGSHGVGMELGLLSQAIEVSRNDTVVTAGISGKVPSGIPIGIVDEVLSNDTELFKRVSLVPYADVKALSLVIVVLSQPQP